ncbi:MAG: Crp/Fnr family transcriptional regulator [Elusimicrobia bacterium]|nr:Crp/Fnr family transcriptional regulator [Elusimicrobiota bacterium]
MNGFSKRELTNCFKCNFKLSCFFQHLEPAAQKVWNDIRLSRLFGDDEDIYAESQKPSGIFVVCKGRAKVFTIDLKGQQMITWIRHPGELFGHIALFSQNEYLCNGRSMGTTILSYIDSKTLGEFLNSYPKTYLLFLHKIANEVRDIQLKLTDTAYKPAKSKVAQTLINAISFKSRNTDKPAIYGLKRTEIAEITGLALETVVRTLADFEKKKIIKREPKAIKILDYHILAKIANPHAKPGLTP